jgi:hypothetical protein
LVLPVSGASAERSATHNALVEPLAVVKAYGAQVYECEADASGRLGWQFREPIATLLDNGKTVGRHYVGPTWQLDDGSTIVANVVERLPGAGATDIPLLALEVASRDGAGVLADVVTIHRLNTRGGITEGSCETPGTLLSVPYTADYVFYGVVRDLPQPLFVRPVTRGPYDYLFGIDDEPVMAKAPAAVAEAPCPDAGHEGH